jgi:uncharacterized protein YdgA (DUF945 family)
MLLKYKKLLFTGILLLLIAIIPYLWGLVISHKFESVLAKSFEDTIFTIEKTSFKRGWYSSEADVAISMNSSRIEKIYNKYQIKRLRSAEPMLFRLHLKIFHTPLYFYQDFSGKSRYHLGRGYAIGNVTTANGVPLAQLRFRINLSGSTEINVFSEHPYDNKKTQLVSWENFIGYLQVASDNKKINMEFKSDNLEFHLADKNIVLISPYYSDDQQLHDYGLWLGQMVINVPTFIVQDDNGSEVSSHNIEFQKTSILENKVVNTTFTGQFEDLQYHQHQLGSASWQFMIRNIDAASLNDYRLMLKHILFNKVNFSKLSDQTIHSHKQLAIAVLSRGLQLQLQSLNLDMPKGDVTVQAWATLPNISQETYKTFHELYGRSEASFLVDLSKPVAEELLLQLVQEKFVHLAKNSANESPQHLVKRMIATWLKQKWLTAEKDQYEISGSYKDDKFYLNQKPI